MTSSITIPPRTPSAGSGMTERAGPWFALFLCLLTPLLLACPSSASSDGPDAATRRRRPDAGPDSGGAITCIRCSMLIQVLSSGFPGGGTGMDPCAGGGVDGGMGGGMGGGFTFCNQPVFDSFMGCLQAKCSTACPFGMGMGTPMCPADGGTTASMSDGGAQADLGIISDGGSALSCGTCLMTRCAPEYIQCGADK